MTAGVGDMIGAVSGPVTLKDVAEIDKSTRVGQIKAVQRRNRQKPQAIFTSAITCDKV